MPNGSATASPNRSAKPSRSTVPSVNSMRRKNVPPSGSVEYWAERTMFAPALNTKRETAATIPGPSGHEITSRSVGAGTAACFVAFGLGTAIAVLMPLRPPRRDA
jgi:hypothetical protein